MTIPDIGDVPGGSQLVFGELADRIEESVTGMATRVEPSMSVNRNVPDGLTPSHPAEIRRAVNLETAIATATSC